MIQGYTLTRMNVVWMKREEEEEEEQVSQDERVVLGC